MFNSLLLGAVGTLTTIGLGYIIYEIRVGVQFARYQELAIDNLRIFDRLLTTEEKTALYLNT